MAGPPSQDAGPDAAGARPLPLGTITSVMPNVSCGMGAPAQAGCQQLTVSCPGIDDAQAVLAVTMPAGAVRGTIVGHGGGTGLSFYGDSVPSYLGAGFRVVQVRWLAPGWEVTTAGNVLSAACRPATVLRWIFDHIHTGATGSGYCAVGFSGGSGVISYALARYGLGSVIDYTALAAGPPFGRIDYGCAPATAPTPRSLCPEAPFDVPVALPVGALNPWEHTQTCGSPQPDPAEIARWAADSVVAPGGIYDYPQTVVSFWDCVDQKTANGTTGGAFFYSRAITSVHSVHCYTACTGEGLGTTGVSDLGAAVIAGCVPRHLR